MPQRRWFSARLLVLACLVGLIVGIGAFWLTSMQAFSVYLGPCHPGIAQGFDPWTGLPHGATLICEPQSVSTGPTAEPSVFQPGSTTQTPTPSDLASRRAVPVPIGFVVGAGLVLLVPTVRGARRQPG